MVCRDPSAQSRGAARSQRRNASELGLARLAIRSKPPACTVVVEAKELGRRILSRLAMKLAAAERRRQALLDLQRECMPLPVRVCAQHGVKGLITDAIDPRAVEAQESDPTRWPIRRHRRFCYQRRCRCCCQRLLLVVFFFLFLLLAPLHCRRRRLLQIAC